MRHRVHFGRLEHVRKALVRERLALARREDQPIFAHVLASRSISPKVAKRTSPARAAVKTRKAKARIVPGFAPVPRAAEMAAGT